jgi:magnesium chelatase family protein
VIRAHDIQLHRSGKSNARLGQRETERICKLTAADQSLLERAIDALQLSARGTHRILRMARTVADLAGSEAIATAHLSEAIGYRQMDRRNATVAA